MDALFTNGIIKTMDGRAAEAVGVKDGRIAFIGGRDEADLLAGAETKRVDLGGRLMLPGFTDTHMHLLMYGGKHEEADLFQATSMRSALETGREFLLSHPEKRCLVGSGWNNDNWSDTHDFPTRTELDTVSRDIPVIYMRACYHIISLNSRALELNNINENTPDPPGGAIDRDEHGVPTGVVRENACSLAFGCIPEPTEADCLRQLKAAGRKAAECGLTCAHSDDLGADIGDDLGMAYRALRALSDDEELPLRVFMQCRLDSRERLDRFFELGYSYRSGNDRLRTGPLKLVADGSLGARTAYMRQPYCDAPETRGMMCFTKAELDDLIMTAASHGMPSAIHAIGDGCIEMALDSIEKAQKIEPHPLRHGIIHCQITDLALLRRMRALNVMALVQPVFLDYDMHIAESRVGALAKTSYAFKTMLSLGIPLSFGSDCPVEFFDPIMGLYHAVTRKDKKGYPEGGWFPEERLSVEEAVAAFTSGPAYAAAEENERGTITPGKLADFTILDRDIFALPPDEIKNARVSMTVVGGKTVYES